MTLIHGYLLGGLTLLSIPVIIHLVMRQKPKQKVFPAFRFLKKRFHTNQRKIQLHQLLLLLLRMLLIAALCFALALTGNKIPPVRVALIFDTSSSMGYQTTGTTNQRLTRLQEAQRQAKDLINVLPRGSQVAIVDSADGTVNFVEVAERERIIGEIDSLEIHHANQPVNRALERAWDKLKELKKRDEKANPAESSPELVYVFSDRTEACWDPAEAQVMTAPANVKSYFIDLRSDKLEDFALQRMLVEPAVIFPGYSADVIGQVGVTYTKDKDNPQPPSPILVQGSLYDRQNVKTGLGSGTEEFKPAKGDVDFFRFPVRAKGLDVTEGLDEGFHQAELNLQTNDALSFNNDGFFTFQVLKGRATLLIYERPEQAENWTRALQLLGFDVQSVPITKALDADLSKPELICLFQIHEPTEDLWKALHKAVDKGKGLVVVPAGEELQPEAYQTTTAKELLPGSYEKLITSERGVQWDWETSQENHPILRPFLLWQQNPKIDFVTEERRPVVHRYWKVTPNKEAQKQKQQQNGPVLINYGQPQKDETLKPIEPVLLEREVGKGAVVQMTTVMDGRSSVERKNSTSKLNWQNYWQSSFGLILVDKICRHLVGTAGTRQLNYRCGETITINLPSDQQYHLFNVSRIGSAQTRTVSSPRKGAKRVLELSDLREPGNYVVQGEYRDEKGQKVSRVIAKFSINADPAESILTRVPEQSITDVMGEKSITTAKQTGALQKAFKDLGESFDPLPWIMLALLLFLVIENVLANRRGQAKPDFRTATSSSGPFTPFLILGMWIAIGALVGTGLGFLQLSGYSGPFLGALLTGLLGLAHGIIVISKFNSQDRAILGGILGSMIGVLHGGLILSRMLGMAAWFAILLGMILGAGLLALDGWLTGRTSKT